MLDVDRGRIKLSMKELIKDEEQSDADETDDGEEELAS